MAGIWSAAPPEEIRRALERLGVAPAEIVLCVSTDINFAGEYDVQWLVLTRPWLFVFDPGGEDRETPLFRFAVEEVEQFRTVSAVGSGLLQVKVEGFWLDLLRYSNRLKHDFDLALKRLDRLKRGEIPPAISAAEAQDPHRCSKCGLMLEAPGELCPRCLDRGAALSKVMQLLRPYWKTAAVLLALLAVGVALDMAWPLLTRYLVDFVLTDKPPAREHPFAFLATLSPSRQLGLVVIALACVQLVRGIVTAFTTRISGWVGNRMTFDVRGRLVKKLQELGLAYYSKQETGSLVGRVAYDTDAISSFISQITSGFLMQFFLVVISFAMMFSLQPELALWAVVPAPLVIAGAFIYWRYVHPHFQRYWDRSSRQAGLLNGILSGIRVVKAFAQEDNEYERFQRYSGSVRQSRDTLDLSAAFFYPLMGIIFQVGGWIVWYVGGKNVLRGQISLGTLMAFFGYLSMFYGPLGSLTNLTTWLTQFSTQIHRIFEILDTPTVLPQAAEPVQLGEARGEIDFDRVTFGYSRGAPVLKDVSFKVRAGEKIGIVGRSGSGKTSLINLLCRFYDVDDGQIRLDGQDIRAISKQDLRSRVSIVLQEPFLFRGTLTENIVYGKPEASPEEIIAAAKAANSHDFVLRHPLGYDTSVGERGQELSGGERQRISIARALLCAPPVLILDEATSSIDSESELAIQMALEDVARSRTVIIIAHRLSTLQNCDRILVVENGQIQESGNHRELMALDGRYASWVRIQQGRSYIEMEEDGTPVNDARATPLEPGPGELPPISSHQPRWLRPELDAFERGPRRELQLYLSGERTYRGVFALRCFPVRDSSRYISLRYMNPEGRIQEIGLIRDLAEWPESARKLIRESLNRRYFFHTIQEIRSIRKFAQFLTFRARTDLGDVEFIMRNHADAAQAYGDRGKLLLDVEDNLYLIPDVQGLTRADRDEFQRHIFW
jgi:ATP-binding cassette subfamily B protein